MKGKSCVPLARLLDPLLISCHFLIVLEYARFIIPSTLPNVSTLSTFKCSCVTDLHIFRGIVATRSMVINSSCAFKFFCIPWTVTCTFLTRESQFLYNLFLTIILKPFLNVSLIYLIYVYVRRTWQPLLLSAPSSLHLLGLDFRRQCRSDMLALCTARLYLISYLHRPRICYHATLLDASPLLHTCLARTVVPISARRMTLWGRKLWAIPLLRV